MVELKDVQKVYKFPIFLVFFQLAVVLLEAMQGQARFVIDSDLERRLHKLFAYRADFGTHSGAEHLNLLLMRGHFENGLDILSHV